MHSPEVRSAKDFVSALPPNLEKDPFALDPAPKSLAFYDAATIQKKYAKVGESIEADRAGGLKSLNELVNAHLHVCWQNTFSRRRRRAQAASRAHDAHGGPRCRACRPAQPLQRLAHSLVLPAEPA